MWKPQRRVEALVFPSKKSLSLTAGAVVLSLGMGGIASADYPERPISMIVPWAADGGTDFVARIVASGLEEQLDARINVVNRTGDGGVVGHSVIADADPDGYTIGFITAEINMMHHLGMTDLTHEEYRVIAMINGEPAGVHVRADSEYETMQDLLDAIRENPRTMTASGTAAGGIFHIALGGMLMEAGLEPNALTGYPVKAPRPLCRNWPPMRSTSPLPSSRKRAPWSMPARPARWPSWPVNVSKVSARCRQ